MARLSVMTAVPRTGRRWAGGRSVVDVDHDAVRSRELDIPVRGVGAEGQQTDDYARRLITAMCMDLDAKQIEALVTVRKNRQKILEGEDAPKLWAVIDEAAIRRMANFPEILHGQLERLLEVEPRTNITLQLLPFKAGFHPGWYGSFMLMGFP